MNRKFREYTILLTLPLALRLGYVSRLQHPGDSLGSIGPAARVAAIDRGDRPSGEEQIRCQKH